MSAAAEKAEHKRLSWWEPAFGEEEARAVAEVVRRGYVNEGAVTQRFTGRVAEALGVRHVLATNSGTVSLFLALKACGVRSGDEVIVPSLTFIATANAVAMCGARPVTADIRLADLNIDPESVARLIGARTKAILPVHIDGRAADLPRLQALAVQHGLALIEDAAQALGSRHRGAALGTIGDAGCISLAPTKIITSGQGGLLLTNRDDIRDAVIRLKDHGRLSRSWNYHPQIGFNFKYSDVYAAIADKQWDRMAERMERNRRQFALYREGLAGLPGIRWLETDMAGGTVPLWVDALVDDAAGLMAHLETRNIDCRPFWPAIHTQESYPGQPDCPNAAYAAAHGVWFPSGAGKTEADIARVVDETRRYLERA